MDLREIGWGSMDCIHLAWNGDQLWALMNMVMNVCVPKNVAELLSS
jgi:hypothetical protein